MIEKSIYLMTMTMMLMSCELGGKVCCPNVADDNNKADYERLAREGDDLAMERLVYYYMSKAPVPDNNIDKLGTATGNAADKARYWAEQSIKTGNRDFLYNYIMSYLNRGLDVRLSKDDRRKNLHQALWTWQRLPPDTKGWRRYPNTISDKVSYNTSTLSIGDQEPLQEIIIALRNLETEK
jgi:hypothetical protein